MALLAAFRQSSQMFTSSPKTVVVEPPLEYDLPHTLQVLLEQPAIESAIAAVAKIMATNLIAFFMIRYSFQIK